MFLVWETWVLSWQNIHTFTNCIFCLFYTYFQLFFLAKPKSRPSIWLLSVQASVLWPHPVISPLPHYQMVRLTLAQIERLVPCVARTSSQCSRVLGISSSGSGSGRAPPLGLATTTGSRPRCNWNSTTWSCFLLACVWWVSCQMEEIHHLVCIKIVTCW